MAHSIIHWNGFDTGNNLNSDYYPADFVSLNHSYSNSFYGWSPFGSYGRMLPIYSSSLRLAVPLPSLGYLALGAQILIGMHTTGITEATIIRFWDAIASAEQISLRIAWNSSTSRYDLRIYRGSNLLGTIPSFAQGGVVNAWTWVSAMVYVHSTSGRIHVRTGLNDAAAFTFSGNTQNTANQRIDRVEVGMIGGGATFVIDNLVISQCDPSDDAMRRVRVLGAELPTGNDVVQMAVTGAAQNWQAVNEVPPNEDTSYVSGGPPGIQDTYTRTWTPITQTIIRASVQCRARRTDAGVRTITPLIKRNGVVYPGSSLLVDHRYSPWSVSEWDTDPATGKPWTPDAFSVGNTMIGARLN